MDEAEQEGQSCVHLDIVEPETFERPQLVFVLGHEAGAERGTAGSDLGDPGVKVKHFPVLLRDGREALAPGPTGQLTTGHLAVDRVEHQVEQFRLAGHIGVQRHRHHPEELGDLAHRDSSQAVGVREVDRGRDDPLDTQTLARAAPGVRGVSGLAPKQLEGASGVAGAAALSGHGSILSRFYPVRSTVYCVQGNLALLPLGVPHEDHRFGRFAQR